MLLVNPMHAVTPVLPIQPSPYFPSSRRFADQVGVAVDALPEYAAAPAEVRARVDALRPPSGPLIDRDAVWTAKRAAFALLRPDSRATRTPGGGGLDRGRRVRGVLRAGRAARRGLAGLAGASCSGPAPAAAAAADPDRVRLHRWIQRRAVEQLDAAQQEARDAGMAVGIVHDLAVGVDPAGADAWLLAGDLATGRDRRGAAGRVQPARAGLGVPAVPARAAGRDRATGRSGRSCGRRCGTAAGCGSTT